MTPLRQRMLDDMSIRNFAENTQLSYVQQIGCFARYFGRSTEQLGPEQVRICQSHLVKDRHPSASSVGRATAALRFLYRVTLKRDWVKGFALETGVGQPQHLSLPTRLRHRQSLLGAVGHLLRRTPGAHSRPQPWSPSMIKQLASVSTADWPAATLPWICPEAAELVQRQDELRKEFGVSPRYFKACSALFASIP